MARTYRRPGGLAVLVAAAAIGLAACGSSSSTPQVASLGNSGGDGGGSSNGSGSSTAAPPTGNPAQLLDEWTACMHSHGDPNQTNPTIDTNKDIHIPVPNGVKGLAHSPAEHTCNPYLTAASTALGGGQSSEKPNPKAEKFSECMRANGIPDFPDPTGNGFTFKPSPGSDLNPNNPTFQNADKVCREKTGVKPGAGGGTPAPGTIEWGTPVPVGNGGSGANG